MKKKGIILILAGGLTLSSMSVANGASVNNRDSMSQIMSKQDSRYISAYNYSETAMEAQESELQQSEEYNIMIEKMKENGFVKEANAMESGDFNAMKNLMNNISDEEYEKVIDIMKNNGYEYMANMMQSMGKEGMTKFQDSMM